MPPQQYLDELLGGVGDVIGDLGAVAVLREGLCRRTRRVNGQAVTALDPPDGLPDWGAGSTALSWTTAPIPFARSFPIDNPTMTFHGFALGEVVCEPRTIGGAEAHASLTTGAHIRLAPVVDESASRMRAAPTPGTVDVASTVIR